MRKAENLTQQQITDRLHIGSVNDTRYETEADRPDYETMIALADLYDVSLDDLFDRK